MDELRDLLLRLMKDGRKPKDLKKLGELNKEELEENRAIKAAIYTVKKQEEALARAAEELNARTELFWCRLRRRLKVEELDYVTKRDAESGEGDVELWGGNHTDEDD